MNKSGGVALGAVACMLAGCDYGGLTNLGEASLTGVVERAVDPGLLDQFGDVVVLPSPLRLRLAGTEGTIPLVAAAGGGAGGGTAYVGEDLATLEGKMVEVTGRIVPAGRGEGSGRLLVAERVRTTVWWEPSEVVGTTVEKHVPGGVAKVEGEGKGR